MKTWIKKKLNLLFVLIVSYCAQGVCMEKPVTNEYKLDNGLKIVVREDHRAPVAVAQIWYKVGSGKEPTGITGISHALEHMMFQGTPNLPADGFAERISEYGGENNAFTGDDFTAYYETLDASNLPISFELEADRMVNLTLSKEAFDKEIQVVIEERRMRTDDNPQSATLERFMAVANTTGPYHHPIVGWQEDLDNMTIEDIKSWYQKWYAPNNATIVVVGAVKGDEIFELAKKYFGSIPARSLPVLKPSTDIPALGEKRIKVNLPARLPYLILGYNVPVVKTADNEQEAFALFLAGTILDGGESSRFSQELVRASELATKVSTYYDPFKQANTQFIITALPMPGVTVEQLEAGILAQIQHLKKEKVSEKELEKAKNQLLAEEIFEKDSMSDQAIMLGMLETIGLPWQLVDEFPEKIKAVTAEQIQAVANKYFRNRGLTVAELIPETLDMQGDNGGN